MCNVHRPIAVDFQATGKTIYCFFIFIILCNRRLVSFVSSSNTPFIDCTIQGRRLNLTLESSDLKSLRSSFKSIIFCGQPCTFIHKRLLTCRLPFPQFYGAYFIFCRYIYLNYVVTIIVLLVQI